MALDVHASALWDESEWSGTLQWHCAPKEWQVDAQERCLTLLPDAQTDFWQQTHYGFRVDNGHFLYAQIRGDFVLSAKIRSYPLHQFDQAGLLVRFSEHCWLKTSVEHYTEGESKLGVVVTNGGRSDWSTQNYGQGGTELYLRVRREAGDYLVDFAAGAEEAPPDDSEAWTQMRITYLAEDRGDDLPILCGPYACSPQGAGFRAEFTGLRLRPGRIAAPQRPDGE